MKNRLALLTIQIILALGCSTHSSVGSQEKKPESRATPAQAPSAAQPTETGSRQAQAMKALRDRLLTASSADDLGLTGADAKAKVWGVMMEVTFPTGAATLVSLRDGTASLYGSTGGGMLGGYSAQKEAKRFVAEAEKHVASMKPTKSFPYPEVGRIKFYVLTPNGVYTAEAGENEVQDAGHSLFPLFTAANEVLTALRTANG